MGFMKSVYFSDDLHEHVNKETNLSGLISNLLREHFKNSGKTEEQILTEVEDKILSKEQEEQKMKDRIATFKGYFMEFFFVTEEEAQKHAEQFDRTRKEHGMNIMDFGRGIGLPERPGEEHANS